MKATNNQAIDQFIIEASLIDPISKIISQLKNGEFRDCDIKWLDKKLENFISFAAETLKIKGMITQPDSVKPKYMCDYARNYYLKYFTALLEYFKSF